MSRQLPLILLLPVLLLLVVWFDDPGPRSDFTWSTTSDVFTLDPQRMSYLEDMRVGSALYEGLVRFDPQRNGFDPGAARSWTTSDDGLTWTFHLREDGRWSNGRPVTAHDFAWSWMRLLTPDTAASYSGLFLPIDGARKTWAARNEDLERFAELFEFYLHLSLFLIAGPGMPIWMVLQRHALIRLLNLMVAGFTRHAQHLVQALPPRFFQLDLSLPQTLFDGLLVRVDVVRGFVIRDRLLPRLHLHAARGAA